MGGVESHLIPLAREVEYFTAGGHDVDDQIVEAPATDGRTGPCVFDQAASEESLAQGFRILPQIEHIDDDIHVFRLPRAAGSRGGDQELCDHAAQEHEPIEQRSKPIDDLHEHGEVAGHRISH